MAARTAQRYLDRSRRCELFLQTRCKNNEEGVCFRKTFTSTVSLVNAPHFLSFFPQLKKTKALGALYLHKTCITIYYVSVCLQKCIKLTLKNKAAPSCFATDQQILAIHPIAWTHYRCPILSLTKRQVSQKRLYSTA